MSSISLSQVVNESFINRFAGLAQGSSHSNPLSSGGKTSGDKISAGLRYGARTFATAVGVLNSVISVVNLSEAQLGKLDKLTDKLIDVTKQATSPSVGAQKQHQLEAEFHKLGKEFKQIIKDTKVSDKQVLTTDGLSSYLQIAGLDKNSSDSIESLFKEFKVLKDDTLASEDIKAKHVEIPPDAFNGAGTASRNFTSVFDAKISDRPSAYTALADLKALKAQIKSNTTALDDARAVIGKNLDLVRAAGFAFLDLSSQITSSATAQQVAEQVRDRIRHDAPAALAQAENLEPMVVAALSLDPSKLK